MVEAIPFNWGILGTGKMGRQFSHDLSLLPRAHISAVGSRRLETAETFADLLDINRRYGSYEELVEDDEVDIVYVATPQSRHFEDASRALEAGKHVLCEKPLTPNATLSRKLARLAEDKGLFLMEALWTRFLPLFPRITELLRNDAIGEPQLLLADIGSFVPFDPAHRLYDPALGGGALLDMGIYPIQLALQTFGRPDHVTSSASMTETGVDEQSSYIFQYSDGRQAVLSASCRTDSRREATFLGSTGKLTIHAPWWKGTNATLETEDGTVESIARPYEGLGYQFEAAHVMTCIANGLTESTVMPLSDSIQIAEVMDQLRTAWGMSFPFES